MKIMDKFWDGIDRKLLKMEKVIRIPHEEMTELITKEYVANSNTTEQKKLLKTLKGGLFFVKKLTTGNGRYTLRCSVKEQIFFIRWVLICIVDNEKKILYKPEKNIKYSRRMYKAIKANIEKENSSRP